MLDSQKTCRIHLGALDVSGNLIKMEWEQEWIWNATGQNLG